MIVQPEDASYYPIVDGYRRLRPNIGLSQQYFPVLSVSPAEDDV
jgi:hypothetical protein